jgi:hypothetical protein
LGGSEFGQSIDVPVSIPPGSLSTLTLPHFALWNTLRSLQLRILCQKPGDLQEDSTFFFGQTMTNQGRDGQSGLTAFCAADDQRTSMHDQPLVLFPRIIG